MGKVTGFLEILREPAPRRPPLERIADWKEIYRPFPQPNAQQQGARCMDCGVPFCHTGCPLGNLIPDWSDLVWRGRWRDAARALHATNNFPEFTGRLCPAPCEAACVLGINQPPVSIKGIENTIIDRALAEGWIAPQPPAARTGKRVAIVGSGPAGLAAAQQLNRAGHTVIVFEKNDRLGGLLRYGIPDFKMDKALVDARLAQLRAEGVDFRTGVTVGRDLTAGDLRRDFQAVLLACGAEQPRDLPIPGRELRGVHWAMDFLTQQNRRLAGDHLEGEPILATGKRVVVIGGGDTGADCVGTCHRQKAASVHQFQIHAPPPAERSPDTPWPLWPMQLRLDSSHEEGGVREWSVATLRFEGDERGRLRRLRAVQVGPKPHFQPVPGTEFALEADLALIAIGFRGPAKTGLLEQFGIAVDARGNVATDNRYMTAAPGVFAAGDLRRGQSLVVWAIAEGRRAAEGIQAFLI
jgi:glutamate synthase (NADPH/NADH) small chain